MNKSNFIILKINIDLATTYEIVEKSLKQISNLKTAIFLDKNKRLIGILTLGDLRRFIKKFPSDTKIIKLINSNPIVCKKNKLDGNLNNFIKSELDKRNLSSVDNLIILNQDKTIYEVLDYQAILNNSYYKQICIVGLGHIGLTLAVHLLKYFSNISGLEILSSKIKNIKNNNIEFHERNLENLLGNALKNNKIKLESDISKIKCQIYIICIGTNITNKNLPNNENLSKIFKSIAKKISKGDLVIMRGTLQVGVSRNLLVRILEKVSKLKCGKDFYFSYMPERIIEGEALEELAQIPQIISGYSEICSEKSNEFATKCFKNTVNVKSLEEAEIIKLASNSFRDINFAFANELARIANIYSLSGHDLIKNANYGYERNSIKLPSIGVGGFCLPKDPYLFSKLYLNNSKGYQLANNSRKINEDSFDILYKKINKFKLSEKKRKIKILFLGIAFKGQPETVDIRNSPTLVAFQKLRRNNSIDLFDVMGAKIVKINPSLKKNIITNIKKLDKYDLVVCINNNINYREIIHKELANNKDDKNKLIIDVWQILDQNLIESYGWKYEKI